LSGVPSPSAPPGGLAIESGPKAMKVSMKNERARDRFGV